MMTVTANIKTYECFPTNISKLQRRQYQCAEIDDDDESGRIQRILAIISWLAGGCTMYQIHQKQPWHIFFSYASSSTLHPRQSVSRSFELA